MTDKLEEWEPGYARREAARRLAAATAGEPYEPKPVISLRLSYPTNNFQERAPVVLLVEDEVSGQTILELELDSAGFHDLLASRTARPSVKRYIRNPGRIGHPETIWTIVCEDQDAANLMRERLRSHGWTVSDTLTRQRGGGRNGPAYVWPVTGRRWDGEPAGTVCQTCRYPLPNSMAAWCAECNPDPSPAAAMRARMCDACREGREPCEGVTVCWAGGS